jgi:hypothetical protein
VNELTLFPFFRLGENSNDLHSTAILVDDFSGLRRASGILYE